MTTYDKCDLVVGRTLTSVNVLWPTIMHLHAYEDEEDLLASSRFIQVTRMR